MFHITDLGRKVEVDMEFISGKGIETGKIIDVVYLNPAVGIRFDTKHERFHDCNGRCEYGHGFYVPAIAVIIKET